MRKIPSFPLAALLTAAVLTGALLTDRGLAQDPAPVPAPPDNTAEMRKIGWMIGSWVGDGEMPGYGKYTSRFVLGWTLNKNFIKQDYWMKVGDKIAWHDTGMIGWDADKKEFAIFSFGFDGTIGGGRQIDPEKAGVKGGKGLDKVIVFEGGTTGDSPFRRYRFVIMKGPDDTLVIDTLTFQEGKFVSMGKTVSRREKKTPSQPPSKKAPESKTTESKATAAKARESKALESKAPDEKAPESRTPEPKRPVRRRASPPV